MVMRMGVQTPALPLCTSVLISVLPLGAGGVQRAASAVSCGWCGSIRRAWRAKRGAHASLPAAAPPHRSGGALLPSPEAHGTEDVAVWRSAPPGAMAYVGLRWLLLTLL